MRTLIVPIKGMHCRSCELLIEESLKRLPGVRAVSVSHRKHEARVRCQRDAPSYRQIEDAVIAAGYVVGIEVKAFWLSRDRLVYRELAIAAIVLLVLYYSARGLGLLGVSVDAQNVTLPIALVVGLVAGISTCMALVGGLILAIAARHAERHPEATAWQKFRPHLYFNLGRVGGYALLGGLLGVLGSFIKLSVPVLAFLTLAVGVVMATLGIKLTGISPRLKDKSFTLPPALSRWLGLSRHQKEYSHRSSVIMGALTFFLPCGFTQAMQIYSVSSGSFVRGALVMGLFALGTVPSLLGIGGLTSVIKGTVARRFYAIVGLAVLLFGLFNVSNALALVGVNFGRSASGQLGQVESQDGVQIVRMTQQASAYSPNVFTIRKGVKVRWIITSESEYSCASSLIVPSLNISRRLTRGENIIEFTPNTVGRIQFSCSMGMYRGVFNVVDSDVDAAAAVPVDDSYAAAPPGGSCGSGGGCGCGGGGPPPEKFAGQVQAAGDVQKLTSSDTVRSGLTPNEFTVKAGQPVEWTITSDHRSYGCVTGFRNDQLGVYVDDAYPDPTVVRFTPTAPGDYDFLCNMDMAWRGVIHVK